VGRFAGGLLFGLLFGLLLGVVAGAGGAYLYFERQKPAPSAAAPVAPPTPDKPQKPRRRGGGGKSVASSLQVPVDPTIVLTPADQKVVSAGDSLKSENTLDMSAGGDSRELAADEIDAALSTQSPALLRCLAESRGAAPVVGKIVFGVVVDGSGRVVRTRVEAPSYLVHHGLYDCARKALGGLHFPATGRETVVTVPYDVTE
jgi:hypothetical protein